MTHTKNEYKKVVNNLDYKSLKKEYDDLNLSISKARVIILEERREFD